VIDLDLLDDQLEQALSDEVRALRGVAPGRTSRAGWATPAPKPAPAAPVATEAPADGPGWDFDWGDEDSAGPAAEIEVEIEMDAIAVEDGAEAGIDFEFEVEPDVQTDVAPEPEPVRPAATPPRPARAERPSQPASTVRRFDKPLEPLEKRFTNGTGAPRSRRTSPPRRADAPVAERAERPWAGEADHPSRPAGTKASALVRLREAAAALSGPDGAPRDLAIAEHVRAVPDLVARGELPTADQHIAQHAALAAERGTTHDKADAAAWEAMRSLLDGRREEARDGLDAARRLGERGRDPHAADRSWALQFWIGVEWGDDVEQYDLLDHCRELAYRYNDLGWRGALTLQLARLGRLDEAAREFDAVAAHVKSLPLDVLTSLAEAAFLLGDGRRAKLIEEPILAARVSLVIVGPAWVCKGSVARFAAHLAAAKGAWDDADRYFAVALKAHRRMHAQPLVARTLHEWGTSLLGRNDELARQSLDEAADLAARLRLSLPAAVAA